LFLEQAQKAMETKDNKEITAPFIIHVAEFAKWLHGQPLADREALAENTSTLPKYLRHLHGGAGSPLVRELTMLLNAHRLVLLFDGLDEAGAQLKHTVSRFIGTTLRSNYNGAIVVTSRESLFAGAHFKKNFDLVSPQATRRCLWFCRHLLKDCL